MNPPMDLPMELPIDKPIELPIEFAAIEFVAMELAKVFDSEFVIGLFNVFADSVVIVFPKELAPIELSTRIPNGGSIL